MRVLFILFFLAMVFVNSRSFRYVYAKDSKIPDTKLTLGINTTFYAFDSYLAEMNDDAIYTYQSSDSSIVSVDKKSGNACTKKKGTAIITITEKLEGVSCTFSKIKVTVAKASAKKEYKFGIGSMNRLELENENPSAIYTYVSSNPSVVSIHKNPEYFSCKKYGSATLTVYENYQGKKTKIGTTKVHVVKAKFREDYMVIRIRDIPYNDSPIKYRIEHAPYKLVSENTSILEIEGTDTLVGKNYGKVKLYAIEYYNNKERKIGPITVEVAPGHIHPDYKNIEMELYDDNLLKSAIKIENYNNLATYSCKSADSSIVSVVKTKEFDAEDKPYDVYTLCAKKEGKTKLTVYETYKGEKRKIGTVNITVKNYVTGLTFDSTLCSNEDGVQMVTFYTEEEENPFDNIYEYIIMDPPYEGEDDPYLYKYDIKITSSDESVIKIGNKGKIILGKPGTAVLKASCGGYTAQLYVNVEELE